MGEDIEDRIENEEEFDPQNNQTDALELYIQSAFKKIRSDITLMDKLKNNELHWYALKIKISEFLPEGLEDKENIAQSYVSRFLNKELGRGLWTTTRKPSVTKPYETTSYIVIKPENVKSSQNS